jgi:hypothetical protein
MPAAQVPLPSSSTNAEEVFLEGRGATSLVDSPDDAFVSIYPGRVQRLGSVIARHVDDIIDGIREQIVPLNGPNVADNLAVRWGFARRDEEGGCAVWIEARDVDSGAYYLPRKELVEDLSVRWRTSLFDDVQAERFFDGPVRLVVSFDTVDGSEPRYAPWFSSSSVGEAEEHFVKSVRAVDDRESSWIASEVVEQLFQKARGRSADELVDSWHDEKAEWVQALRGGTIAALSVDTAGRRVYVIEFAQTNGFGCEVVLGDNQNGSIEIRATLRSRQ